MPSYEEQCLKLIRLTQEAIETLTKIQQECEMIYFSGWEKNETTESEK